jgi:hypothetical protein
MHPFIHPGIIVASALGALVICLIVVRYGLTPSTDAESDADVRGRLLVRFGHAMAAVCFAVTAMLATVALVHQGQVVVPAAVPGELEQNLAELTDQARAAEQRIGPVEGRVDRVETTLRKVSEDLTLTSTRLRQVERFVASADRERVTPAPRPPEAAPAAPRIEPPPTVPRPNVEPRPATATPPPPTRYNRPPALAPARPDSSRTMAPAAGARRPEASAAPSPPAAASVEMPEKLLEDWKVIRQGFREAGTEIRNFWARLSRRASEVMESDRR